MPAPPIKEWSAPEVRALMERRRRASGSSSSTGSYSRARVPEYWIIDLDARVVEQWQPNGARPTILTETLNWHPDDAREPLAIDLTAYFREVPDG